MSHSELQELDAILLALQEVIRQHRQASAEPYALPPADPLARVRERRVVNPHLPIGWPEMPAGARAKLTAYAQKVVRRLLRWYINPIVAQQNEFNAAVTDLLGTLVAGGEARAQHLQVCDERLARIEGEREVTRLRLQRLENERREAAADVRQPAAPTPQGAIDYFLLGALYRNRLQMADRLGDYDDLFRDLIGKARQSGTPPATVLDIGCGRGEFVSHLISLGLPAYGIDLDADALAIGQAEGLDLRQVDAFAHLADLPDASLAAVTMIQVIEHMEPEAVLNLLKSVLSKLAPGGLVIAETINPACLFALSNWYLMDPSHRTPMHSETTRFLMMQAGFHRIEVRFLHPVPEEGRLRNVSLADEGLPPATSRLVEQVQRNTEQLNQLLYGPQDYAAIACKPEN